MTRFPTLTVVTVTLNCADTLPGLMDSLLGQTDQDFDWVVFDGGSKDDTVSIAKRFPPERLTLSSGPDFGIYDALNKAVKAARGDYYLVLGADDQIYPNAIENFRRSAAASGCDIIAAKVDSPARTLLPLRGKQWLRGGNAYVASHAVGSLIRRQLHDRVGFYSNRYVNVADMHFVLSAVLKGGAKVSAGDFIAGKFSDGGVSTVDRVCSLSDFFRIQLAFGHNKVVQLILYVLRLIRAVLL